MKNLLIGILLLGLVGCASFDGTASIYSTESGVLFDANRPTKMTMEKDGAIYTYDSQSPSLLSKIMGALTLGVIGAKD